MNNTQRYWLIRHSEFKMLRPWSTRSRRCGLQATIHVVFVSVRLLTARRPVDPRPERRHGYRSHTCGCVDVSLDVEVALEWRKHPAIVGVAAGVLKLFS